MSKNSENPGLMDEVDSTMKLYSVNLKQNVQGNEKGLIGEAIN